MKVAELCISYGRQFTGNMKDVGVGFTSITDAQAEFDRLVDLMKRREDRANELEKTVTVKGINIFTCPLDEITAIGLCDFALQNAEEAGVKDTFPLLFGRS